MSRVYIIAGGPGDPELITLKAKKIIDTSDYIFTSERFINKKMFVDTKSSCRILDTFTYTYDEKLDYTKKAVAENKILSFITMGDPALYGMVGGLIDRFEKNDIAFEIIPGVNAAIASSAVLKRGLTGMGVTNTFVCTSYNNHDKSRKNLEKIAALGCTVSVFMGIDNLKEIIDIFAAYRSKQTPIAIVSNATWHNEKIIHGNLGNIMDIFNHDKVEGGLILIGDFLNKEYDYDLERQFIEMKKKEVKK
jgi:precorrin-4 methylase